jgi:MerR family transcriptional regulator/heat shock protein HspR
MPTKRSSGKAYYMISAVAQKYNIHPQTLRLYEREGLLRPSRTEGNTSPIPKKTWSSWRPSCR